MVLPCQSVNKSSPVKGVRIQFRLFINTHVIGARAKGQVGQAGQKTAHSHQQMNASPQFIHIAFLASVFLFLTEFTTMTFVHSLPGAASPLGRLRSANAAAGPLASMDPWGQQPLAQRGNRWARHIASACLLAALAACGGGDADEVADDTDTTTPTAGSTAGVRCTDSTNVYNDDESVKATSTATWSCSDTQRMLTANGIPDHEVGTFPSAGNPNTISAQTVSASTTLTPAIVSTSGTAAKVVGYVLNGVKMDPNTGGTCNDSGTSCSLDGAAGNWRMEALGQTSFDFGADASNAHVQPSGEYHYHGLPEGYVTKLGKGQAMTLIGWASDGFPIYARYGYSTATDAASALKVMTGSYRTKTTPDANRPATSLYPMGTFLQDYEYVAGLGDLDECNGRTGVTPEFPNGTYHYYATDSYPYIQRCIKGTAGTSTGDTLPPPPR